MATMKKQDEQQPNESEDLWATVGEVKEQVVGDTSSVVWARRILVQRLHKVPVMRQGELLSYAGTSNNPVVKAERQASLAAALEQLLEDKTIALVPQQYLGGAVGRYLYLKQFEATVVQFYREAAK